MYGPDPHSIMQYAKMLAAEEEKAERRRASRRKAEPARKARTSSVGARLGVLAGAVSALFRRRAVAYRG